MSKLAIDGGSPVRTSPMPAWPVFDEEEIQSVCEVLRSGKVNYWTGNECASFEVEFAEFAGCAHAIALANGTLALELALRAFEVGPGDEVIVPSRTFVATATSAMMLGATPVFADVDSLSGNITLETIQAVFTDRCRAIIPVHLGGWPVDMDPILSFARERNLRVIEDCAQAHGASYKGRPVGSLGDAAAFSFCQDKNMTTGGEGGMFTTSDSSVWKRAWSFKDHGKSYDTVFHQEHPPGFRWLHEGCGTNWRMTEMQAAIGRKVLAKLPSWVEKRRAHADMLDEVCSRVPFFRVEVRPSDYYHSHYRYYVYVEPDALPEAWSRDRIVAAIGAEGVPCMTGSCSEIYREKTFEGIIPDDFTARANAKELAETAVCFLVHPTIGSEDMADVVRAVEKLAEAVLKDSN